MAMSNLEHKKKLLEKISPKETYTHTDRGVVIDKIVSDDNRLLYAFVNDDGERDVDYACNFKNVVFDRTAVLNIIKDKHNKKNNASSNIIQ